MNNFERQDFDKLNEQLAMAMIQTTDANGKQVLNKIADAAQRLHSNYSNLSNENWNDYEEELHTAYSELLGTHVVDAKTIGEIKIYLDNLLMDTFPREKEEVANEEAVIDSSTSDKLNNYDDSFGKFNDWDQKEFEEINREYKKL